MPKGPKGEKRPADVVGAAVKVAKIATGEVEDVTKEPKRRYGPRAHKLGPMDKLEEKKTRQD